MKHPPARLWIPGPTELRPEILEELARPMIGHRSQAMEELIERIDPGLRLAFGLPETSGSRVAVGTHGATAMMEGALLGVGARVLAVVNGGFSRRWCEIAAALGKQVRTIEVEWGAAIDEATLARELDSEGPFDALIAVINETSTGVRTPFETLHRALEAHPQTLLLVDVVSALGGFAVDFDANRLDFALAGVNKALALPPGLCVFCASERYVERARSRPRRGWFLDPLRALDGHARRKPPTTPSIPHYRALARQLEDISAGRTLPAGQGAAPGADAWRARFAKHERMRDATLAWARGRGLEVLPPPELCSPTVSCIRAGSIDVESLVRALMVLGYEIGNGYGALRGTTFRIGHMGDHDEAGLAQLLAAADEVLG